MSIKTLFKKLDGNAKKNFADQKFREKNSFRKGVLAGMNAMILVDCYVMRKNGHLRKKEKLMVAGYTIVTIGWNMLVRHYRKTHK